MHNINYEIQRLLDIKQMVDSFNLARKNSNISILPVSQDFFNRAAATNKLMNEVLYYIFDKDIGQYIDGYLE